MNKIFSWPFLSLLNFDDELLRQIDRICKRRKITRVAFIREAIVLHVAGHLTGEQNSFQQEVRKALGDIDAKLHMLKYAGSYGRVIDDSPERAHAETAIAIMRGSDSGKNLLGELKSKFGEDEEDEE